MNVNENKSLTSVSGGCGCGGGAVATGGCSCGGNGCGGCNTNVFARPNFFAGQLLTEDDLQQLGEYVVAKNRLHNRFLFGEGVVCGLDVTCHPCGEGRVIVQPGYALDCCGNDLTLACAKTLDINAMVRELRRSALGHDCGDPCKEGDPASKPNDLKNGRTTTTEDAPNATRHYCLYLRYCEELTDPVAPYSTGDPCGAPSCQTTRIREGVKFELRCQTPEHPRNDLLARIVNIIGDPESFRRILDSASYHRTFSSLLSQARRAMLENPVMTFDAGHTQRMVSATAHLDDSVRRLSREGGSVPRRATVNTPKPAELPNEADVRNALDAMLEASAVTARFYSADLKTRRNLLSADKEFQAKLNNAKATIAKARDVLNRDVIELTLAHPLEKGFANGMLEVSDKLAQGEPPQNDIAVRSIAEYSPNTEAYRKAALNTGEGLRQWLLERLDRSPNLTDCGLRSEVERLDLTVSSSMDPVDRLKVKGSAEVDSRTNDRLLELFARYLRDAICVALNPTCAPCDDPSVLLACVDVKDCEVVRICNLERSFVLSPAALRYWLFPLTLLGEALETLCCRMEIKIDRDPATRPLPQGIGFNEVMRTGRPSAERQMADLVERATGFDIKQIMRLGEPISSLLTRPTLGSELHETSVFRNFGTTRSERAATAAPPAPPAPPAEAPPPPQPAIPFDPNTGPGKEMMEHLKSMVDVQLKAGLATIRKEFAEARPTVTTPPPAVEKPQADEAPPAPTPSPAKPSTPTKKAPKKPKNDTAAEKEEAAKDEDK